MSWARRLPLLLVALGIIGGLALGIFVGRAWLVPVSARLLALDAAAQDDYIILVAEAYALDHNIALAQHRLNRLNSPRTTERIIQLALEYAPQRDYVAQRLALLAVSAGATDRNLVALAAMVRAPTPSSPNTSPSTLPLGRRGEGSAAQMQIATPETAEPSRVIEPSFPTSTPSARPSPQSRIVVIPYGSLPSNNPNGFVFPSPDVYELNRTAIAQRATRTPRPTLAPTRTPTLLVDTDLDRSDIINPMPLTASVRRIGLALPDYANMPSDEIRLAPRPPQCTPPERMPAVVTQSLALCAGQVYAPFQVQGHNLTIYGDENKTALVRGEPRRFAITVMGTNISLVGVHVEGATHPDDFEKWLCLYPSCFYDSPEVRGALGYGGGILLKNTSNAVVMDSQFNGGTIGIAALRGFSNKIVNNHMTDLNGWGVMLQQTRREYVVGNQFVRINRACHGLNNDYHPNGCESSGMAIIAANDTLVYDNHCRRTSNCYYANGDGGYGSTNTKFFKNDCAAAKNNCFEVTFSQGSQFDYNRAEFDAEAQESCDYPFWVGGSTVYFGSHNSWDCRHDSETALNDARSGTERTTEILELSSAPSPPIALKPTKPPTARAVVKPRILPTTTPKLVKPRAATPIVISRPNRTRTPTPTASPAPTLGQQ